MPSETGSPCGITREHTLWCSQCPLWETQPIHFKKDFIRVMKVAGWKQFTTDDGREWFCPNCVKARAKGKQ